MISKSYTISILRFHVIILHLNSYSRNCIHYLYQLFYLIRSEEEVEMAAVGSGVDTNTKLSAKQKDAIADKHDEP